MLQTTHDASNTSTGACILHRFPNGVIKPIYHASCTLTTMERTYSQIAKEGFALIFAITKFHRMIFGRKFMQTDHKALLTIFDSRKDIPVYIANRLQRWTLLLRVYDFNIEYVKTTDFGHVDVLSRLIDKVQKRKTLSLPQSKLVPQRKYCSKILYQTIDTLPLIFNMVKHVITKDKLLKSIMINI